MKKANRIIRDLKHLKGNKYFGVYEAQNKLESKNLYISELDIIRGLASYEIDFKKVYGYDFETIAYDYDDLLDDVDCIRLKHGYYIDVDDLNINGDNSYNWNSQVVFDYGKIKVQHECDLTKEYVIVKFHRYGDVRGNYTDYMVLDMNMDWFYETIMECSRVYAGVEYKGCTYSIDTDAFKESCLFDIYSDDAGVDDYDVYLDIDNFRNLKDIKKGLIKYLKEQELAGVGA